MFLTRIARGMASDLETSGYKEGCPIATTALETSSHSEVLGAATRTAFQKWENEIRRGLERFGIGEAELVATTVLSQLEGALLAGAHLSQPRADAPRRTGAEAAAAGEATNHDLKSSHL